MIFFTYNNTLIDIKKSTYIRDTLFYNAVHMALFNKHLFAVNFTQHISNIVHNKD